MSSRYIPLANLICSPAVLACIDSPFGLEPAVLVLGEEVVFSLDDKVQRHDPTICVYSLDHCNLLPIARLLYTRPATALETCYNLCTQKYTYLESSLSLKL
ncbi:hypothetical protein VTK56DRAFT_8673 [Thermocarpiscus australiensis]